MVGILYGNVTDHCMLRCGNAQVRPYKFRTEVTNGRSPSALAGRRQLSWPFAALAAVWIQLPRLTPAGCAGPKHTVVEPSGARLDSRRRIALDLAVRTDVARARDALRAVLGDVQPIEENGAVYAECDNAADRLLLAVGGVSMGRVAGEGFEPDHRYIMPSLRF
jgi:hypothetical protein